MNILVVGLGLIGGSLCKALKKYTYHTVTGCDLNHDIENAALRDVALDNVFDGSFEGYDLIIIALFPQGSEIFFKENAVIGVFPTLLLIITTFFAFVFTPSIIVEVQNK